MRVKGNISLLVAAVVWVCVAAPVRGNAQPAAVASGDDGAAAVAGGRPRLSLSSPLGELRYTPGRGLKVGRTRFSVGGYANANLSRDEGRPARIGFDDLSFFLIWNPSSRVELFSELEVEDLVEIDERGRGGVNDAKFVTERLYGDLVINDHARLRAGKFLSPVGRWNEIHAQPLVWTTSRPLATERLFPLHVTGMMLSGSLFPGDATVSYALFGQPVSSFHELAQAQPADRSAGARIEYAGPRSWSLGGTYFAFRRRDRWKHMGGLDFQWFSRPVEVMAELAARDPTEGDRRAWGGYLQSVVQVGPHVYAVGRYEYFSVERPDPGRVHLFDIGFAWKPLSYLVFKTEYQIADRRAPAVDSPHGFKASFAVLF